MLTNHKRRNRVLTLAVLTLLVGLPELVFAQQSGLFPNAPIRRTRPNCDQQDPIYKLYRDQYFGYHPTSWRKFPDGWGFPSPEAPDKEKSFREIKRKPPVDPDAALDDGGGEPGPGGEMDAPADKPRPSPFEQIPAVPEGRNSPFDVDPAPAGAPPAGANPTNPQTNRTPVTPGSNAPEIAAPGTGRTTSNGLRERTREELDDRPTLAMSDEVVPVADAPADREEEKVMPAVNVPPVAQPTQPPARRGMLSGLFSGNWRRR